MDQFTEIRNVLESETDYLHEAESLREARSEFSEDDGILVPKVYDQYSTRRVLTMEYIEADSMKQFLAKKPPQKLRDHFGEKIYRASSRLFSRCRMYYSDFHPGNFLFLDDGRLGFIDFGGMRRFNDREWEYFHHAHIALNSESRKDHLTYIQRSLMFSEEEMTTKANVVDVVHEWSDYYWAPFKTDGPFDFGNPEILRRGMELWHKASQLKVFRQQPVNIFLHRGHFELIGLLYQLGSRFDCRKIYDEEAKAIGWDE